VTENKIQSHSAADRRYTYLRCREAILAHKYPNKDKTNFEQYVFSSVIIILFIYLVI
jgi:hypothetical protein